MSTPVPGYNPGQVLVGGEDRVAGGILYARRTTGLAVPTSIAATTTGYEKTGYISEDGLTVSQDMTWQKIRDWNGDAVRHFLQDFTGTVSWTYLQTSYATMKSVVGEDNVTGRIATTTKGNQLDIKLNATVGEPGSYVFNILDGIRRARIVVPIGTITTRGDWTYTRSQAVTYPVTLETTPDASGTSIYVYTDDGLLASA